VLLFFPLCGSAVSYITEKKAGTLQRSLVAGMTSFEIMVAYLNVQLVLLIVQTLLGFGILRFVFQLHLVGQIWLAILLAILVGVCGMSLGFLVAAICRNELEAVLLVVGTFLPNMLLSGTNKFYFSF
jgi:ABC-type multidrug transport system permease subunit